MGGEPLDLDAVFDALSVERRRHVLSILSEQEAPVTLADLADEVAVRENEARIDDIPSEDVERIYLDLYHSHIPKLGEIGAIERDEEENLVTPTEVVDRIDAYLRGN